MFTLGIPELREELMHMYTLRIEQDNYISLMLTTLYWLITIFLLVKISTMHHTMDMCQTSILTFVKEPIRLVDTERVKYLKL